MAGKVREDKVLVLVLGRWEFVDMLDNQDRLTE